MKRLFATFFVAGMAFSVSAQDNMEGFSHLSIGAEAGLHGLGVEIAMPISRHLVVKAGYNWAPSRDLFSTDLSLDTKTLRQAQEDCGEQFQHKFDDEALISAGLQIGLTNYKVMFNWYPFYWGRLYFAGGVYYTPDNHRDDPFIRLSGLTSDNDWAALMELREKTGNNDYEMALEIGDEKYAVIEKDGCGYMQADFKMDPIKYYAGVGLGRCIPDYFIGLQLELGAMIYQNGTLYCQDKEVGSIMDVAQGLGNDAKEIIEYAERYHVYPQMTLRLSFRMF